MIPAIQIRRSIRLRCRAVSGECQKCEPLSQAFADCCARCLALLCELLGGICVFLLGRRLGHGRLERIRLAVSEADAPRVARAIFQTSWRQDRVSCALHTCGSVRSGHPFGGHDDHIVAHLPMAQSRRLGRLHYGLHSARVFSWQEVEASASMVRADGAICDHGRNRSHLSRVCVP